MGFLSPARLDRNFPVCVRSCRRAFATFRRGALATFRRALATFRYAHATAAARTQLPPRAIATFRYAFTAAAARSQLPPRAFSSIFNTDLTKTEERRAIPCFI